MSDLIDRKELLDFLYELEKGSKTDDAEMAVKELIGYVASMPSAEPQIIRCKDCKYYHRNIACVGGEYSGCILWLDNGNEIEVKENDFCSYAERRVYEEVPNHS